MFKLKEEPSAHKREHPKMKFMNFFLFLCVIIDLLDPDCESGPGSTTLPLKQGLGYGRNHFKLGELDINPCLFVINANSGFDTKT